jgi:hypothetical protein
MDLSHVVFQITHFHTGKRLHLLGVFFVCSQQVPRVLVAYTPRSGDTLFPLGVQFRSMRTC